MKPPSQTSPRCPLYSLTQRSKKPKDPQTCSGTSGYWRRSGQRVMRTGLGIELSDDTSRQTRHDDLMASQLTVKTSTRRVRLEPRRFAAGRNDTRRSAGVGVTKAPSRGRYQAADRRRPAHPTLEGRRQVAVCPAGRPRVPGGRGDPKPSAGISGSSRAIPSGDAKTRSCTRSR